VESGVVLSEQVAEFAERGVVYLRGAFTDDEAARMRRRVWARLARLGVLEDDMSTWATPIVGVSKSIKRDAVFAAVGSPAVVGAIDDLLGADQWDRPPNWGTVMVTFPDRRRPWTLPRGSWHTDYWYVYAPQPLFGVKVFAFFGHVRPRGGGTLVILGSHRVLARFVETLPPRVNEDGTRIMQLFLKQEDWFRSLARSGDDHNRTARFMETDHQVGDAMVRVMELTGNPGDVVLTHPWVMHSQAPNIGTYPRLMMTKNLYRRGAILRC
jgi:ectoine hydroxylase-related dioxygenase (phytanoyl-CoA dioxygenase family)